MHLYFVEFSGGIWRVGEDSAAWGQIFTGLNDLKLWLDAVRGIQSTGGERSRVSDLKGGT